MKPFEVNDKGICGTCKSGDVCDKDILTCFDCKSFFHSLCGKETPFGCKTFVHSFNNQKNNFLFLCDYCLTLREQGEASVVTQQILNLTNTVNKLVSSVNKLEAKLECENSENKEKIDLETESQNEKNAALTSVQEKTTKNDSYVKVVKSSICIKSNGNPINIDKFKEIAIQNSIQVSKTTIKPNGDLFVDLPSAETREKLQPLLVDEAFSKNEVINLKSKLPTISIFDNSFYNQRRFHSKSEKPKPGHRGADKPRVRIFNFYKRPC